MTAAVREMRKESSQRALSFGLEVVEQVLGIHSPRDKPSAVQLHRTQQFLAVPINEDDVANVDHALSPARLEPCELPVRSQLGHPWTRQPAANRPPLLAGRTRVDDLQ